MPVACFVNEDIKKVVVEIEDRHHYLRLDECDDVFARLEGALVEKTPTVGLALHDRRYTLKREAVELLLKQGKEASAKLEALVGRPEPPVNVKAQLDKLAAEKSTLQKELEELRAKFEAMHTDRGVSKDGGKGGTKS